MFTAPPERATRIHARVPDILRRVAEGPDAPTLFGHPQDSFLEGPSIDRDGGLLVVDTHNGRILKTDGAGGLSQILAYDGMPCGLKLHRDGRAFVADYARGLLVADLARGTIEPLLERYGWDHFRGCNDLVFASNGDLYFTDQGMSGLHDPTGRVFCLRTDGRLDLLLDTVPSPNGIALNPDDTILYVAVTRANAIWRVPLSRHGTVGGPVGTFVQLSGSLGGPDGIALDSDGNLVVAHHGLGAVWLFSRLGEPMMRYRSCAGLGTTNVAFGGADRRTLFITESQTGTVLAAEMDVAGLPLFG